MTKELSLYDFLGFIILLLTMSFVYNYHEIVFERPMSTHTWRQTDGASIALNYYQLDLPLLEPRLHNLYGNEGKTVGEFPIVYYVVGKLYKVFGPKEIVFRMFGLLLFFLGLFYLFRTSLVLLKNRFYALVVVAMAFSSPIVVFYANNFLPNTHALSLVFVAWFFLVKYVQKQKVRFFVFAILLFSLAGLIKVTALVTLCAFMCVLLFELLFIKKPNRLVSIQGVKLLVISILPFLLFAAWVLYAKYYQELNENEYFLLNWKPIWELSAEKRSLILDRLTQDWGWWPDLYWSFTMYALVFVIPILFTKKMNYAWRVGTAALILGVLSLILLYYANIDDHDYYLVNLLVLIPFITLLLLRMMSKTRFYDSKWTMALVVIFVFFNIQHTDRRMQYRYNVKPSADMQPFYDLSEEYLLANGITLDSKLLYDGEESYCAAFYFINRYGWSKVYTPFLIPENFTSYIEAGAKFLFVVGEERNNKDLYKDLELIDIFNERVYIYKLEIEDEELL